MRTKTLSWVRLPRVACRSHFLEGPDGAQLGVALQRLPDYPLYGSSFVGTGGRGLYRTGSASKSPSG